MKQILIHVYQKKEIRIAIVDNKKLYDLYIEKIGHKKKKSDIYKGIINRIEPSLEALFIDYGGKKHGFLPFKEISDYNLFNQVKKLIKLKQIKQFLKQNKEIIVQIRKEEKENKGAALTNFITLTSNYLVLMPNNPGIIGISRKIHGKRRTELKNFLSNLSILHNIGLIIRTASSEQSITCLEQELNRKIEHWKAIQSYSQTKKAPFLIYKDSNIILKCFRDYLNQEIKEIIIDDFYIFEQAHKYFTRLGKISFKKKIKFFTNSKSLFNYFHIEEQILSIFKKYIKLPSGGSIILENTEALIAIDVNSSKDRTGIGMQETAFNTNLEAIEEISRQLRIRDLSGLIVIDFIDMKSIECQKIIEKKLKKLIQNDRARIQIGNISKFGLLEMSRQHLNTSLNILDSDKEICPICNQFKQK
ncbi:Ribonuclease E [Buchnera aphidicola (Thelaxes suberi)]|uniref:Rne/Rng family ribonuclease n=1 Tax=Buchnera aphidicola TaxID=9 RepID=UPI0034640C30